MSLSIGVGYEAVMSVTNAPTFDQALALARRLPPRDQARLIALLVEELAAPPALAVGTSPTFALPVLTGGTWTDDLPLNRKDLYDDDERC
jgi:hypothetical protein